MALSIRQLKNRIRNIENVHKITSAMEMISVSKLRTQKKNLAALRDYFTGIEGILNELVSSCTQATHPLFESRPEKKTIVLCLFTSDTGLCGSYNNAVIRSAEEFRRTHSGCRVELVVVGRKGLNYFKKNGWPIKKSYTELFGRYSADFNQALGDGLIKMFLDKECDEVYALYTYFESVSRNRPRIEKILNFENGQAAQAEYILEPDAQAILKRLVPLYILEKLHMVILHSFVSEHSSRVLAMGEATDNAQDVLDDSILLRNKLRQANITREIIEVISSADALRG